MKRKKSIYAMSEADIQSAVFGHLDVRLIPGAIAWHTPNGGSRNAVEAAKFKGQGVKPGIPDVVILAFGRLFGLELKTEDGKLTKAQREMLERLAAAGATTAVAYGLDAALQQLEAWGLLRKSAHHSVMKPIVKPVREAAE